jgi:hypothetical protein
VSRWKWTAAALAAAAVGAGVVAVSGGGDGDGDGPRQKGAPRPLEAGSRPDAGRGRREGRRGRRSKREGGGGHGRGIEIALQDNAVLVSRSYYDRERALAQTRALGASWVRMSVLWYRVAGRSAKRRRPPARPPYDWTAYDSAVSAARAHGLRVELSLSGPAPAWAAGNGRVGNERPDAARFGEFARAAAAHFRGLVTRYSIWNEPNYVSWLTPRGEAPRLYRQLYQEGWSAIKAVDPGAQVLIGETAAFEQPGRASAPLAFLRGVACPGCAELHADGYAHHPYDFTHAPEYRYPGADNVTIGTLPRLFGALNGLARTNRLSTSAGGPLPVYLTEFGYFASGARALPAATRAAYLRRAFDIAARQRPRVRQMLQYMLAPPPRGFVGSRFDTSLTSSSGAAGPVYEALAAWARSAIRAGRAVAPAHP